MDGGFFRDLGELNERLGARPEALDLLRRVQTGEADVILTGQQPGILGGPLYNYLKLATAVVLARRWSAAQGRPVLPVFWGVTDDTDFGEVSWTLFPDHELKLKKIRTAGSPPTTRTMVGSLPGELWDDSLTQLSGILSSAPGTELGSEWLSRMKALPGEDWGERFLSLLLEISGRHPLIVVDGRRRALLDAAAPLFQRYVHRRDAVVNAWRDRAREIRSAGREPALSEESAGGALFAVRGDERFPDDETDGLKSPNVVLRPLLQGHVFPLKAVVVGPGEIRYRMELRGVYDVLELGAPPLVPRFSATILPPAAAELPGDMDPAEWLLDPPKARARLETSQREGDLSRLLEELRGALGAALNALSRIGEEEDRSYPQMVSSAERKMLFQIQRLEEGLRAKIRSKWFKEIPGLAHMADFLRPRRQPQERGLNILAPGHLYGPGAYGELDRWVEQWVDSTEGTWARWILGPPSRGIPDGPVPGDRGGD